MQSDKQKLREIQVLLHRHSGSSNKDIRRILAEMNACPTPQSVLGIFDRLFGLAKYSNKEMLWFLDVFLRFTTINGADLKVLGSRIVDLKFAPSEKDTDSVILKYFEVANAIRNFLSFEESKCILSRYMFILGDDVVSRGAILCILQMLRVFLGAGQMHTLFVNRKMYKNIDWMKGGTGDFCKVLGDEEVVDIALEHESFRTIGIDVTRSRYLFQVFYALMPKWYLVGMHRSLIPYLYYAFDRVGIYKNVCEEICSRLPIDEMVQMIDADIETGDEENECEVLWHDEHERLEAYAEQKVISMEEDIKRFNDSGDMQHMFEKYGKAVSFEMLRYFAETDLKKLGHYVCKLKNQADLKIFTDTFDFHDMEVLEGLRMYLLSFYLLGEGQIIHRVVEAYAERYYADNAGRCTFMRMDADEKTKEFVFNLSFSFLALNTKFHNPNVKLKPTFKNYISDFSAEEIPEGFSEEYLETMYGSIKRRPLEFAVKNQMSKEHYKMYKRMCGKLVEENAAERKLALDVYLPDGMKICARCKREAHRRMLSKSFKRFFSMEAKQFCLICSKLGMICVFEEYMMHLVRSKEDLQSFADSFVCYLDMRGSSVDMYVLVLEVFARIERQKGHNVFSDLGISFLKGNAGKERGVSGSGSNEMWKQMVEAEEWDLNVLCDALKVFADSGERGMHGEDKQGIGSRKQSEMRLAREFVVEVLGRSSKEGGDLSMLDEENVVCLMKKCVEGNEKEKFCRIARYVCHESLLRLYKDILEKEPGFVSERVFEMFKEIPVYNEDGFCCTVLLQSNGVDMFDFAVEVRCESVVCRAINAGSENKEGGLGMNEQSCEDMLICYNVEERYVKSLSSASNLFSFYGTSNSVMNQSKARMIHKSGCPLEERMFDAEEMDKRLIYMIKKADMMGNRDVTNYTLWIVNLLSSSLPLFARFFVRSFGILLTLRDQTMTNGFIKIFCSRVSKALGGSGMCCDCGYASFEEVEQLIEMLVKYDFASNDDFLFYFNKKNANGTDCLIVAGSESGSKEGKNGSTVMDGNGPESNLSVESVKAADERAQIDADDRSGVEL
ncbi:guanine-nucleotide-exchange-factor [Ordospora pajunii]|uniref:guanine-nucleotide-exchange-factor n=1 Tax=Ordospora pajunii TaxID=3039483 RepID=UPI0029527071|nr:guanine-nucleotide-exchange-factor [Ordospora pajunii]KAH9411436.1 guanine-nucleotide-exchange-factor [Ordospora pajunii]